ncbi:MFS transporter [Micromonospora sp. CPCC 206061]|uniref:MFS transporter n=1 Tax=Micromonospora sp. CPCC 206061 TaxID=3122410 RepID=UPI002FF310CF
MTAAARFQARSPGPPLIAVGGAWGAFWGVWGGLLPAIPERIGSPLSDLGIALVAVPVGAIPAMALTGRLARGRERLSLAAATLAFAASIAALATVSSAVALGVVLMAVGMTSGALDVCLNMAAGRAERETGRRLFQPVHAAFPVGVVVFAPLAGLARQVGVGVPIILGITTVLVLAAAAASLTLPLGAAPEPATVDAPVRDGRGNAAWRAAGRRLGLGIGLLGACMLIVENGVEHWSALLLEDFRDAPPVLASSAPALYYLALTGGRLLAQAVPGFPVRAIVGIGAVGGGAGIVLAALVPSASMTLLCLAVTGLAFGPLIPALLSHAARHDPDGRLVALVTTTSYGGFVASPLFVATLNRWLSLPAAVACLGLLTVPLLAAAVFGRFAVPAGSVPDAVHARRERAHANGESSVSGIDIDRRIDQ